MSEKGTTSTRSFDESLIDMVRVNPLLFEKSQRVKPYESMKQRSELWKSIATSLHVEPNFCIARWKHLCVRYRREIEKHEMMLEKSKEKSQQQIDEWPLMEKMRFLDKHTKHYNYKLPIGSQPASSGTSTAETSRIETISQIFSGVNYENLPEAMDEQPLSSGEAISRNRNIALPTSTQNEQLGTETNPVLVRVEALLGGLGQQNRPIAEKRILSYLCKCQLKALDGESIEDVQL